MSVCMKLNQPSFSSSSSSLAGGAGVGAEVVAVAVPLETVWVRFFTWSGVIPAGTLLVAVKVNHVMINFMYKCNRIAGATINKRMQVDRHRH